METHPTNGDLMARLDQIYHGQSDSQEQAELILDALEIVVRNGQFVPGSSEAVLAKIERARRDRVPQVLRALGARRGSRPEATLG